MWKNKKIFSFILRPFFWQQVTNDKSHNLASYNYGKYNYFDL